MRLREFFTDESGMGVVEVILIIVVLIAMVIIFKSSITTLVNNIWTSVTSSSETVTGS